MNPPTLSANVNVTVAESSATALPQPRWWRRTPFVIAAALLLLLLFTAAVYFLRPEGEGEGARHYPVEAVATHAYAAEDSAQSAATQQIAQMVDRLAERLKKEPDNGQGWQMLARFYAVLGNFPAAAGAFARASALLPEDADTLADYADALVMTQDGAFSDQSQQLIQRALALAPQHPKALALAGSAAFKRQDFGAALVSWNKALAVLPADSELAQSLKASSAEARRAMAAAK